jgi:glycerol-3-phosphate acyltransferase PlsX
MKIMLDGMGGDHAPKEIVKGAVEATGLIDHEIVILGDKESIENELIRNAYSGDKISIRHTTEVIEGEDAPVKAIRSKKDSSMVRGLEAVRDGEGDVFISAGNSGAILTGGILVIGRIPGIDRPALGSPYPIIGGAGAGIIIDAGANADIKPHNLLQFAVMGNIYIQHVFGVKEPKIGLVNVGTEPGKGSTLLKKAYKLLEQGKDSELGLNFIGNIEARDIPIGICDVYVCDGFTGNVVIKMTEGMALSIMHLIREKFTEGLVAKAGSFLLLNKLTELKKVFDYAEYGGAPLLGLKGPVVKMHGSSDAKTVKNGIIRAASFAEGRVVEAIAGQIEKIGEITNNEE